MSLHVEGNEDNFKWGIAIDAATNNSDFTPYRSFTYKGVEYSLYDCIYLYREGEKETDIGKLVKIWRTKKGGKRGKVLWFFRPSNVFPFLRDYVPSWNELFSASGHGKGVANLIPLEAIAGKCNVVCTSRDPRNTPPSVSDLRKASYFFSHTFDVGDLKISDKFPDNIDKIKVERLLNWKRDKPKANGECRVSLAAGARTKENPINVQIPSSYEDYEHCSPDKPKASGECSILLDAGAHLKDIEKSTPSAEKPIKVIVPSENFEHCNQYDAKPNGECRNGHASGARLKDVETPVHRNERPLKIDFQSTCDDFEGCTSEAQLVKNRKLLTVGEADSPSSAQGIRRWFTNLPWEERLKEAQEHEALVHLVNLDPSYTSSDVQDIISRAFKLHSYAKIIRRGHFCNPLYGEALVIFNSKDDADTVINELQKKCLVVGEGRPLIACRISLNDPIRTCNFPGHIVMDNSLRLNSYKRKAVFTSHCTQANTIEHAMATEWRLLQQISNLWWKALRKEQACEISKCISEMTKSLQSVEYTIASEEAPALESPVDALHSAEPFPASV